MFTRRQFLWTSAAVGTGALATIAIDNHRAKGRYADATNALWRVPVDRAGGIAATHRALIHAATLAPSSHNTQCWKFRITTDSISILPDVTRRCPAVDPDDHHLHISLGCAAENLVQAAGAHGLIAMAHGIGALDFTLETTPARSAPLFKAIAHRQSTRSDFDGATLSASDLALLQQAGAGDGVQLTLITARPAIEQILELVTAGNTAQLDDPAFVDELLHWIRFSRSEAIHTGDGLFTGAAGNPIVPRWIGSRLFSRFLTADGENEKYASQLRTSAGVAVFVADVSDAPHWVEVGRRYERFALQCTALDIRTAMINQPVEVPVVRTQLATHLGIGNRRPDLVVRFGRGPRMPQSLRRPVSAVLV